MNDWKLQPATDSDLSLGQRLRSVRREGGLIEALTHSTWLAAVRLYMATYHRLHVVGRENLPAQGPCVVVANHCSHLDALVVAAAIHWRLRHQVFPIAAGDTFFSNPLQGMMSAVVLNALPMWRKHAGSHAMTDLRQRLMMQNAVFIVFPEGTRSRTGLVGPFKPGLGMLVAGSRIAVAPCRLTGAFESFPATGHWPRPTRISLSVGAPLDFANITNDRAGWQLVADRARAAVLELP